MRETDAIDRQRERERVREREREKKKVRIRVLCEKKREVDAIKGNREGQTWKRETEEAIEWERYGFLKRGIEREERGIGWSERNG